MPSVAEARAAPDEAPVAPADDPPSSDSLSAYRTMVLARVMDERCLTLQRQGRIGFYVPLQGQEAAQVGCARALDEQDWIFPAYRELGVALARGIPVQVLINQFYGNSGDELRGRQMPNHYGYRRFRFVTASSPVGTQISHAVGAAMAARLRKDPIGTICFFGDGTTSSNDFHAGLNFAGVFQTPTIFFCQNNQWAISLPRERQTRSATLAEKAAAYGFPGVVVDGMDLHAVHRAVSEARSRALAGGGPTLIEAQVYRLGPHSTSDDPKRYRSDAELNEWKEKDPVARLKKELRDSGALSEEEDHAIWEAAKEEVARAVEAAEKLSPVEPLTLFDDVFAERTPALEEQRAALAAELARDAGGHP
ncbi:MAG TPA: thiamine pyrophosphate-dependent dehydrogenase E1 component subunit alpha [Thermoplasmata archaeon]|nr:thiamine pyrophosphate-dependent dehydrogenase E1 component subunit alpha [Thermoplasmata archaeon]